MNRLLKFTHTNAFYIFVVVALAAGVLVFIKTQKYFSDLDELSIFATEVKKPGAQLSLYSDARQIAVGQTFTVHVQLDTRGESIDGVDLYAVKYDPSMMDLEDADRGQAGTQITSGGLMPVTVVNRVDEKTGTIQFAQVTNGGSTYKGKGKFASLTFKALKKGETIMSFDYIPGNTADTNVAANGVDRLKSAESLKVVID